MKKYLFALLLVASYAYAATGVLITCTSGLSASGTLGWVGTYGTESGRFQMWFPQSAGCPQYVNVP